MRKLALSLIVCFTTAAVFAACNEKLLPVDHLKINVLSPEQSENNDQQLLVYCLLNHLSVKQYEKLSGKKLSIGKKLDYFLIKHQLKKTSYPDKTGISIGGFCLGFFLGPIGVLIAFLVKKNKTLRKWSLRGLGVLLLFFLIMVIIVTTSLGPLK